VDGRTSQRLIRGASGPFACETIDGKTLLFQPKGGADSPLMAMPVPSGPARQLVACVNNTAFGVAGVRSEPESIRPCLGSENRQRPAPWNARRTRRTPDGSGGVARRQDDSVSENHESECRPDVDRELPVKRPSCRTARLRKHLRLLSNHASCSPRVTCHWGLTYESQSWSYKPTGMLGRVGARLRRRARTQDRSRLPPTRRFEIRP
jgi:hypothetical protein